jgi:cytochrome c oxidase cbb3-type subunit III
MAVRSLGWVGMLAVCAAGAAVVAGSQRGQGGAQEGVQQQGYRNMTPAQRAAATRAFLGLGAEPDRAAAERGAPLFQQNCAFCHGPSARGATGPSLITSDEVLADNHGEHLTPFLKKGVLEKGMPAFANMTDEQLKDIAEFLHLQVEDVANRGTYHVLNILVGDAGRGKTYVEAHCMTCHTAETFAHIASRFRTPDQLQRGWVWPARDAAMTVTVKTAGGTISGRVTQISDFRISLETATGETKTIDRGPGVEVKIDDPLKAHEQLVMTLKNDDMHNATAYLETLK